MLDLNSETIPNLVQSKHGIFVIILGNHLNEILGIFTMVIKVGVGCWFTQSIGIWGGGVLGCRIKY